MFNSLNNKNSIYNFKKVIDDVINANLENRGLVKYISAVVVSINDNNTVNVYIPPDNKNTITGIVNKCGEILQAGDSVELCTKNGSVKNSWVAIKHGKDVSGAISDNFPIGSIIYYGGTELPNNWFFCDGRAISRTAYPELFSRFGTTYGEGDGSTTFNLPDMRGKVGVGLDTTDTDFNEIGKIGGSKYMQAHVHTMGRGNDNNLGTGPNQYGWQATDDKSGAYATNSTGEGDSGNLQPYTVVNYIVKVSNSFSYIDVSKASVINNLTNTSIKDALSANMGKELNEKIDNLNDAYWVGWSRTTASGAVGYIQWINMTTSKSKGITYDVSDGKGKFIFENDGIYAINGFIHWRNMPDGARTFLDVEFTNGGDLCPVGVRSTDNQWERGDPCKEFTKVYAIKGGCIMNFELYSSTTWTLLGSANNNGEASGFTIQKIGEYPQI